MLRVARGILAQSPAAASGADAVTDGTDLQHDEKIPPEVLVQQRRELEKRTEEQKMRCVS